MHLYIYILAHKENHAETCCSMCYNELKHTFFTVAQVLFLVIV